MPDDELPWLRRDGWITLARIAAAAGIVALGAQAASLMLLTPTYCPGWYPPGRNPVSIWVLVALWSFPVSLVSCFVAIRWEQTARSILGQYGKPRRMFFGLVPVREPVPAFIPPTQLIAALCASAAAMSATPLLQIGECLGWLGRH